MTRMFQICNHLNWGSAWSVSGKERRLLSSKRGQVEEVRGGGRGLREQGFVSGLDFILHAMGHFSGDGSV